MTSIVHSDQGDLLGLSGAVFSDCGYYRYQLWRTWDSARPEVAFVMLNPSTADALADDPTIRRCIGFARAWGAGSVRVVNLYAWRATDPAGLNHTGGSHVVGEVTVTGNVNDAAIAGVAAAADRIVVAWGAWPGPVSQRASHVLELLRASGRPITALGLTKHGQPRHPLYVRSDALPLPYPPLEAS